MAPKLGSHHHNALPKASLEYRLRRVMEHAIVTPDGCVEANNKPSSKYPHIQYNGKEHRITRLLMEYAGYDLTGKVVMHTCDNPRCVYPAHLIAGSQKDNIVDSTRKGRHGLDHRSLTLEEIISIFDMRRHGYGQGKIAEKFGVSRQTVWTALQGRTELSRMAMMELGLGQQLLSQEPVPESISPEDIIPHFLD